MNAKGLVGKILPYAGIILIVGLVGWALLTTPNGSNDTSYKEGDIAPDFTLPMVGGGQFILSEFKGKKNVLLYFQEGIMCPACWSQQVDIEKRQGEFDALNTEVVMITVDPPNALMQAKAQYGIKDKLLYDNSLLASVKYDVLRDSMHPGERPGHVFVFIGKDGVIKWRYSAYKPAANGDHHGGTGTMYVPVEGILSSLKNALQGTGAA